MPVSLFAPQRNFPTLSVEICFVLGKSDQIISLAHSLKKILFYLSLYYIHDVDTLKKLQIIRKSHPPSHKRSLITISLSNWKKYWSDFQDFFCCNRFKQDCCPCRPSSRPNPDPHGSGQPTAAGPPLGMLRESRLG